MVGRKGGGLFSRDPAPLVAALGVERRPVPAGGLPGACADGPLSVDEHGGHPLLRQLPQTPLVVLQVSGVPQKSAHHALLVHLGMQMPVGAVVPVATNTLEPNIVVS